KGLNFEESMMQFDVAATIAYIFGLEQPQVWIGRPMKQVFAD
ncbi:MAG: alkaline phosphatase, partial [Bacteroidales bacterium]|nr:alkaline phosphatase [Bacteroidales bacterium]